MVTDSKEVVLNTNCEGGEPMNLEVIESGITSPASREIIPVCDPNEFFSACCIIHFWGWEPGTGMCC